ncbi:hypothetical protein PybrP1_009759 [[Pythium] brassicae (nom. inval.)]|nr:hypothetical protein PybrP1_009759 [[Pythium] brassicae (nom. inval.)]
MKHRKVHEKVFTGQRKVFNMEAKHLEGTEAENVARRTGKSGGMAGGGRKAAASAEEQPLKNHDWKSKSSVFRDAMKVSRDVTIAPKEGREVPPMKSSAPDPSLIQCEYCSLRLNDKAAERHITFCRKGTHRDSLKSGPPKTAASAPPAKPTTRAPIKKR